MSLTLTHSLLFLFPSASSFFEPPFSHTLPSLGCYQLFAAVLLAIFFEPPKVTFLLMCFFPGSGFWGGCNAAGIDRNFEVSHSHRKSDFPIFERWRSRAALGMSTRIWLVIPLKAFLFNRRTFSRVAFFSAELGCHQKVLPLFWQPRGHRCKMADSWKAIISNIFIRCLFTFVFYAMCPNFKCEIRI